MEDSQTPDRSEARLRGLAAPEEGQPPYSPSKRASSTFDRPDLAPDRPFRALRSRFFALRLPRGALRSPFGGVEVRNIDLQVRFFDLEAPKNRGPWRMPTHLAPDGRQTRRVARLPPTNLAPPAGQKVPRGPDGRPRGSAARSNGSDPSCTAYGSWCTRSTSSAPAERSEETQRVRRAARQAAPPAPRFVTWCRPCSSCGASRARRRAAR